MGNILKVGISTDSPIALAMDFIAIALSELANVSERKS
jgi:histidine ammonia-lyase